MEKKMYFENPTQVVWVDEDNHAHAGIAYGDVIICGCCGGTVAIDEIRLKTVAYTLINKIRSFLQTNCEASTIVSLIYR